VFAAGFGTARDTPPYGFAVRSDPLPSEAGPRRAGPNGWQNAGGRSIGPWRIRSRFDRRRRRRGTRARACRTRVRRSRVFHPSPPVALSVGRPEATRSGDRAAVFGLRDRSAVHGAGTPAAWGCRAVVSSAASRMGRSRGRGRGHREQETRAGGLRVTGGRPTPGARRIPPMPIAERAAMPRVARPRLGRRRGRALWVWGPVPPRQRSARWWGERASLEETGGRCVRTWSAGRACIGGRRRVASALQRPALAEPVAPRGRQPNSRPGEAGVCPPSSYRGPGSARHTSAPGAVLMRRDTRRHNTPRRCPEDGR